MTRTDQISAFIRCTYSPSPHSTLRSFCTHLPENKLSKKNTPGHFGREPRIPRRSLRQAPASLRGSKKPGDSIGFFVGLNISMPLIATIAQEMVSFREDTDAFDTARPAYYGQISHYVSLFCQHPGHGACVSRYTSGGTTAVRLPCGVSAAQRSCSVHNSQGMCD